jgi:hypothetical protein
MIYEENNFEFFQPQYNFFGWDGPPAAGQAATASKIAKM